MIGPGLPEPRPLPHQALGAIFGDVVQGAPGGVEAPCEEDRTVQRDGALIPAQHCMVLYRRVQLKSSTQCVTPELGPDYYLVLKSESVKY